MMQTTQENERTPLSSCALGDIPTNVTTAEQLHLAPSDFLSGDEIRPLIYRPTGAEEDAAPNRYALQPTMYSVVFILLMESLERFSYYGVRFTITAYLTGVYDRDWNAGLDAVSALSLVSISAAVAYTSPFLGAVAADSFLGDYSTVLWGTAALYIPGLLLIACTTVPLLLGNTFNLGALVLALTVLEPAGAGAIKSVVNVFGAKQHHPVLQSSLIKAYYVTFYICINIGALAGGLLIPAVAQHNVTVAYFIPAVALAAGIIIFKSGESKYVHGQPRAELIFGRKGIHSVNSAAVNSKGSWILNTVKVNVLVVPFMVAYSQIVTTFVVQGTVMEKALGWIDASIMINCDGISVLFWGYFVATWLYPMLTRRGIRFGPTDRFAIGSMMGVVSILWALTVERKIHEAYRSTAGGAISVLWQAPSFILIGAGEIFAVSSAYEIAYTIAPAERKALASAINLFLIGAVPNFLCIGLYQLCRPWFCNDRGDADITLLGDYVQAEVGSYFAVLMAIILFGVGVNSMPSVRRWVMRIEMEATEMVSDQGVKTTANFRETTQQ